MRQEARKDGQTVHRKEKRWYRIIAGLTSLVVFCTVHAAPLTAMALEMNQSGVLEHTHSEACYSQETSVKMSVPDCSVNKQSIHQHTSDCYDTEGKQICKYADFVIHRHNSTCYDESGNLWCTLPEIAPHTHDAGCYAAPAAAEVHTHTDDCYSVERGKLICTESEEPAHVHTSDCYAETPVLTCTEAHEHTDSCSGTVCELTCGCTEEPAHQHADECYEQIKTLICEKSTEPVEDADTTGPELTCGKAEIIPHEHTSDCFDDAGKLICGKIQILSHQHTDACFKTVVVPADTETLTCTLPEDETHTHGPLCYGTWKLTCGMEDDSSSPELTEEEWARVDAVIALIDELPSSEEIEETAAAFEEAEDEDGLESYLSAIYPQIQTAYHAYDALTADQQAHVSNADKLMELEWVWGAATYDSGNTGTIRESLDGDWAYITDFSIKPDTTTASGLYIRTGTSPWDGDDEAGNDSSELNNVLRTFDTASYTVQFNTKLREAVARQDVGGIKQGRLYFEFVLPCSEDKARFETDAMGWLSSSQNVKYETVTASVNLNGTPTDCQVLRGSFTLVPTGSNEAAIGASTNELTVVIRAMKMNNGDTIQPTFTLWLHHNDVGATYNEADDRLPASIVTGTGYDCPAADNYGDDGTEEHGVEAQSVTAPVITVSARLMLNIAVSGVDDRNTQLGTFDFNKVFYSEGEGSIENAINYGLGKVTGRMNGYGILLETRGKEGQGMRGMAFPDSGKPITFELRMNTAFKPEGGTWTEDKDYLALFWGGYENAYGPLCGTTKEAREVNTALQFIPTVPINKNSQNTFSKCEDGGTWIFEKTDDPLVMKVTVSGFAFGTHFPYAHSGGNSKSYTFYNPETVGDNWWEIDRAVFSTGKVFLVQPYYHGETYVCDKYNANGQFYTYLRALNMCAYAQGDDKPVTKQVLEEDDLVHTARYLKSSGSIDGSIQYLAYRGQWNQPLTAGALNNDSDWATAGSKATIFLQMSHSGAEGDHVGVASDNLVKFYGTFFSPDSSGHFTNKVYPNEILWGAKPDGTDWVSDDEMKRATVDDLIYYAGDAGLAEMRAEGKLPVAALIESRMVLTESTSNEVHCRLHGTINADCPIDQVYMTVRNSYAWRKVDVAEAALDYYKETHPDAPKASVDELTDEDYNDYTLHCLPTHHPNAAANGRTPGRYYAEGSSDFATGDFAAVKPFWWHDFYHTSNRGSAANPGTTALSECAAATPATYPDGSYTPGHGIRYYQDSCLVMGFKTSITKQTAQHEQSSTDPKKNYDMNQNQRTVDYQLMAQIDRNIGSASDSSASALDTVVYVEDTLPVYLTYVDGSARFGGSYEQDPLHQNPGTITGGQTFESTAAAGVNTPNEQHPYLETVTCNADGTTTIRWMFQAHLDMNATFWSQPIRFSCSIGTPGVEETDVQNGQSITNTAKIWADGDSWRAFKEQFGNLTSFGITVSKTSAVSLSKRADQLVTEWWDPMGFTMNVGNNSSIPRNNTIIAETLPYKGLNRSTFHGDLQVEEFSAAVADGNGSPVTHNFQFFYTTDTKYAGKLGSDYQTYLEAYQAVHPGATLVDWMDDVGGWTRLNFDSSSSSIAGMTLYSAANLPENLAAGTQITGIVAVGDLPASTTMKLHITVKLPDGKAGDYLVNYLSQDTLSSYARTQVVSRSLEGLTWIDANADGLQDNGENRISGVKVSLYWLKDGQYEPYTYGEGTPAVIETGKMLSVQTGTVQAYEGGRYKFTDLPAGTFAVKFEDSDNTAISKYIASPSNRGGSDDTKDSDGIPTYNADKSRLEYTWIERIVMEPATKLTYGIDESKYHDSGFYERGYELPNTGGMGTTIFYVLGSILAVGAIVLIVTKKRMSASDK